MLKMIGCAAVTAGISYIQLPTMGKTILTALGCLIGKSVVTKTIQFITDKIPYSPINITILKIIEAATSACFCGYAGMQYEALSQAFWTLPGFVNFAMSQYCNISYYLNVIGCVTFGGAAIVTSVAAYYQNAILNSPVFSRVITAISLLADEMRHRAQTHMHTATTPQIITEEQLEEIAPLQCPGLYNPIQGDNECSICRNNLTETQMGRTLPCNHMFHAVCIDQWLLQRSATCPMCRGVVMATGT